MPAGYEFIRVLGQGATGWVALARHVRLERLVAIKTIHAGVHDRAGQKRLVREGRVIVALRHPAIVTVYELAQTPAGAALVMEYVPGGDLRTLIDSGRLTGAHAASLLCEVAAGLAHAHGSGIVHRDVKPANVLLTADGHAKIADFGLARLSRVPNSYRTTTDSASGTPTYMAPEQILDPTREIPAGDVYSFAVLAYEMLTGSRPYPAQTAAAVIEAHLHDAPVPPWQVEPGLDRAVGEILLAALAIRPQERPSAEQIAERISRVPSAEWDALAAARVHLPTKAEPDATSTQGEQRSAGESRVAVTASHTWAQPWVAPTIPAPAAARRPRARGVRISVLLLGALAGSLVGFVVVLLARHL